MKKFYLLILLGLGFGNISSQSFSWAKDEGLYAYDYGLGIVTDNAGSVYVAGKYEMNANFSGTILPCLGSPDCNHEIYLAKYSSGGSLTWIRTAGGSLGDYAHAVACDGSNNVVIAGEIEGASGALINFYGSTTTLTTVGDNDVVLAKYDLNGNLLWAKSEGSYNSEKAEGVCLDNAGNIFICGHWTNSLTFSGTTTLTGAGAEDIFIAKYDANGNFQWARGVGGPGRDEVKGVHCDASGNVYATGYYSNGCIFGSTTYSTVSGAYLDVFVAKYSPSGSLLWVKTAGGSYDDAAWSITMDNAGLLYISGEFNAAAYFGPTQLITAGNADAFVACYDQNGNEVWAKRAGGPLVDRARGIGCDGSNLFITGQFGNTATFGTTVLNAADSSDVFFASMNNSGTFLSAASVTGPADATEPLGYESGTSICAEATGNVYATGALLNGGTFGSIPLTSYGRTDMFVTKINQMVGIHSISNSTGAIHVYPNPGSGNFTVILEEPVNQKNELTVYNCLGQIIYKKTTPLSKINVDLSDEENGVYFIKIKTDDKILTTKRVVIQK